MYASYFGLKHEPFSIAPDPRYLFMSERHREALAHLVYGLGAGGGFVLLTGEIGTGKTTLCRLFLDQIPTNCNVAYIFNPKLTVPELLQSICEEFHVTVDSANHAARAPKDFVDALNAFLIASHAAGRNNVLVIDEAQNLAADVLEQLRLLTNLETSERKLLQIILIGQPELRDMLARPELEQLAQRVIARYHLGPLSEAETARYVQHRLEVAGLQRPLPFERRALRRTHALARGVPRRINLLCDRALLGAYANSKDKVDAATVSQAAREVFGKPERSPVSQQRTGALLALGLVAAAGLYAARVTQEEAAPQRVAVVVPASAAAKPPAAMAPAPGGSSPSTPSPAATQVAAPSGELPTDLIASMDAAWRELAPLWHAEVEGSSAACAALASRQLECFSRPMSLSLIRELGRPGIVTLEAGGKRAYAVLTGVDETSATLLAGGRSFRVSLQALASHWQGDFATLWRSPQGYDRRTPAGTAQWVAERLGQAGGTHPPSSAGDVPVSARLRAFQLAHGLPGDGQPGPLTYMQLNRATGVEEPRLRTGSGTT